jgi:hypothetical protein
MKHHRSTWFTAEVDQSALDPGITVRLDGLVFGPDGHEYVNMRHERLAELVREWLLEELRR